MPSAVRSISPGRPERSPFDLRRVDLAPEAVMPAPPDTVALMAVALVDERRRRHRLRTS